jgi:hypothetical protein
MYFSRIDEVRYYKEFVQFSTTIFLCSTLPRRLQRKRGQKCTVLSKIDDARYYIAPWLIEKDTVLCSLDDPLHFSLYMPASSCFHRSRCFVLGKNDHFRLPEKATTRPCRIGVFEIPKVFKYFWGSNLLQRKSEFWEYGRHRSPMSRRFNSIKQGTARPNHHAAIK